MKIETRNNKTIVSDIPDSWFEDYSAPKQCLFFWDLNAPLQTDRAKAINWGAWLAWSCITPWLFEQADLMLGRQSIVTAVVFFAWLPWFLFLLIVKPGMEREKRFRRQMQAEL